MKINNHAHGQFTQPGEVRLTRLLPGPIERVWAYLTDPEKRSRWFAGGPMELRPGGKLTLVFHHANISPHETPPAEHEAHHCGHETMPGTILRCEPPRLLSYTFSANSDVTFELTPQGDQVLLVLTHRSRGEDIPELSGFASGWHTHVAILIALLEGVTPPLFWATHRRLKAEYSKP